MKKWRHDFARSSKFHSKPFPDFHVIWAPLYNLLHDYSAFHRNEEHKSVFIKVEQTLSLLCELTVPKTKNSFSIIVDSSAIVFGTVLVSGWR